LRHERSRRYWRMCVIPLGLAKYLIVMATPAGFEPATFSLEGCHQSLFL
jgi:hypothetical protein